MESNGVSVSAPILSLTLCVYVCVCLSLSIYIYVYVMYVCVYISIYIYDAGLLHPSSPPRHMVSPPLPAKRAAFSCLALLLSPSSWVPPPPCGVGPVVFLVGPARLWGAVCSAEVWYSCCRLLVVMPSLRALSPPPFWGAVCSTKVRYGCC